MQTICAIQVCLIQDGRMRTKGRGENTGSKAFKEESLRVKQGRGKKQSLEEAPRWHLISLIFPQGLAHWFIYTFYKQQLGASHVSALTLWNSHSKAKTGYIHSLDRSCYNQSKHKEAVSVKNAFQVIENIVNCGLNRIFYL